jgi:hypothetical protein
MGAPIWWEREGNSLHVIYDQTLCNSTSGHYEITAFFAKDKVTIDFRAATGIVYDTPSGQQTIETQGVWPVECHVAPAYESLFEFDRWIGHMDVLAQMPGETEFDANTYLNMDWSWNTTYPGTYWLQPTLKAKVPTEYQMVFTDTDSGEGSGYCITDNFSVQLGERVNNVFVDGTTSGYVFKQWNLTNVGCTDIYNAETAWFWLLTAAPGSVEAQCIDGAAEPDIFTLTMAVEGSGTTTPPVGRLTVLGNRITQIAAYPASGWSFSYWSGLPDGRMSQDSKDQVAISENTTVTACFIPKGGGTGDGSGDSGGAAVASGIWGGITNSLSSVGLGNAMGRMMVVLAGMVVAAVVCGKNKTMRVVAPLGVLGIGIIGFWVPIWIVIVLAIGVGVGLLGMFGKKTAA